MTKTALLTGASGFIGKHLLNLLIRKGYYVHCIDIVSMPNNHRQIESHTVDCRNLQSLRSLSIWQTIDVVFHLAGVTQRTNLKEFRLGNVLPTSNLLKVLAESDSNLERFVFISSQAAAGPAIVLEEPKTEQHEPNPVEAYGQSKLEAERVVKDSGTDIPYTIIRPAAVYGPGDHDFLNVFRMIKKGLGIYPGCRDNYLSIIYVDDLVEGILRASVKSQSINQTYFLCGPKPVQWSQIYTAIANATGKEIFELNIPQFVIDLLAMFGDQYTRITGKNTLVNSQKIALSKSRYWICSSEQAERDIGITSEVLLPDGIEITHRWYIENGWL